MRPTRRSRAVAAVLTVTALVAACSSAHTTHPAASPAPSSSSPSVSRTSTPTPTPRATTSAARAHLVYRSSIATPDRHFTPGSALVGVTTAQICAPTWNAAHKTISFTVQNEVSAEYGVLAGNGTVNHLDQLIPATLGGDATAHNVWPQPADGRQPGWETKNRVETRLHQLVCQGHLALSVAQQAIASDWLAAMHSYLP